LERQTAEEIDTHSKWTVQQIITSSTIDMNAETNTDDRSKSADNQSNANKISDETNEDSKPRKYATDGGQVANGSSCVKEVRHYSTSSGRLYSYRDGDKFVTTIIIEDSDDSLVKEEPVERTSVEEGEKLWTIPHNWEKKIIINRGSDSNYVYTIPETGTDLFLSTPIGKSVKKSYYHVESVGTLTFDYAGKCDWERLEEYIKNIDDEEEYLLKAANQFYDRRYGVERKLKNVTEELAYSRFFRDEDPVEVKRRVVEPWSNGIDKRRIFRLNRLGPDWVDDGYTYGRLFSNLEEKGIISSSPRMRIRIKTS